jgi:hypothetical protein
MKIKTAITAFIACLVLAAPGAALAASPTEDAYSGVSPQKEEGSNGPTSDGTAPAAAEAQASSSGSLPFTGFEAGIAGLIGVALLAGGAVLFRISRQSEPRNS